jgi:two-component system sensor histidine kinase AlgZ
MIQPQRSIAGAHSQRAYWLCQLGGWTGFGFIQGFAGIVSVEVPWERIVGEVLVLHAAGLGMTHLLRHYVRRNRWITLSVPRLAWRILFAAIALAIPIGLATTFMAVGDMHDSNADLASYAIAEWGRPMTPFRVTLQVVNWAAIFGGWLIIYFMAVRLREQRFAELRQSELARALQLAELRLLKSQLNPHFLFNALNTIRSLIAYDPTRAQDGVTRLASTLRYTLNSSQDELVTLAQELEIVDDYLALESMRFDERLKVELDIPASVRGIRIPVMLLQTVVENAIKHGIAELPSGGTLRIRAALDDDALIIEVANPKPTPTSESAQQGIGLKNSAERLRLLFGSQGSLLLDLSDANIATARIRVPRAS